MDHCNKVCNPIVPGCRLTKDEHDKPVDTVNYKKIVGCVMYMLATRFGLAYSVCLVARYMEKPTEVHLAVARRILGYLRGNVIFGVLYKRSDKLVLQRWSDSNYAGDIDDRKNTTGYVFMLGSSSISRSSKKQPIVTLSTTKTEFIAAASCAFQCIWFRNILYWLGQTQKQSTIIMCDNNSTIKMSQIPIMHGRCKHIDVRFHFLRDLTKDRKIEICHCSSENKLADVLTKPLKLDSFCTMRTKIKVCELKDN